MPANSLMDLLSVQSHGGDIPLEIDPPSHTVAPLRIHHDGPPVAAVHQHVDMADVPDDRGHENEGHGPNGHLEQEQEAILFPATPDRPIDAAGHGGRADNQVDDQSVSPFSEISSLTLLGDLLLADVAAEEDRERPGSGDEVLGTIHPPTWARSVLAVQIG